VGLFSAIFKSDPIKPWYEAIGQTGDYVMIRFGRIKPGASNVEWVSVSHSEFDGIGGFASLLREKGVEMEDLPINTHLQEPSWKPFLKSLPKLLSPRRKLEWREFPRDEVSESEDLPDPVLAWHVFSEEETIQLRGVARQCGVTVNSFLMKRLDEVLRKDQIDPKAVVPWMVPVNLRGPLERENDTENHSSYVSVRIDPEEGEQDLHREIYRKLELGEHWANWKSYSATRLIPAFVKRALIRSGRAMAEWNLGLFTNLGVWDPDCEISHEDFVGSWMVAATVLRCQSVGAGLMTFQGRLSLTIQAHPDLTTDQSIPDGWMADWIAATRRKMQMSN